MIPLGGTMEAPQEYIMVHVVPGVTDVYVPEQTVIFPKNVIRPELHLPELPENYPITTVP